MTKALVTTDLVKIDQIKSEFSIYALYSRRAGKYLQRFNVEVELKKRFMFFTQENYSLLQKHGITIDEILLFFRNSCKENKNINHIPDRYLPVIKNITDTSIDYKKRRARYKYYILMYKKYEKVKSEPMSKWMALFTRMKQYERKEYVNGDLELHRITFQMPLISFMQQVVVHENDFNDGLRLLQKRIVEFFVDLTKRDGDDFDVYIDNWTAKLMKEAGIERFSEEEKNTYINKDEGEE